MKLSVFLNYAIFKWNIEQDKKGALKMLERQIRLALGKFEQWPQNEFEDIRHQVELI